jgi:hypothetical protein
MMDIAEIKRACALITTMVVLFALINNNPQNDHHIKQTLHKDAKSPNGTSVCLTSALQRELLHNTSFLLSALVPCCYQRGVTLNNTAWGATTETFSDDFKFAIPKI